MAPGKAECLPSKGSSSVASPPCLAFVGVPSIFVFGRGVFRAPCSLRGRLPCFGLLRLRARCRALSPTTSTAFPMFSRSSTARISSTSPMPTRMRRRVGCFGCRTWGRSTASTTSWRKGGLRRGSRSRARATWCSSGCSNRPPMSRPAPTGGWRKAWMSIPICAGWRSGCGKGRIGTMGCPSPPRTWRLPSTRTKNTAPWR